MSFDACPAGVVCSRVGHCLVQCRVIWGSASDKCRNAKIASGRRGSSPEKLAEKKVLCVKGVKKVDSIAPALLLYTHKTRLAGVELMLETSDS